ncbi:hypothetical protein BSL78_06667 [Apostichopus japonicus]|uniref:Uncharacterized protein n=1 Tax=Stichopus japonicus TaxID=307972 RepID=A0A2G8L822_STIJA|nr:hypothetical protein BSL78_06667 [Apostichopus japonicus]
MEDDVPTEPDTFPEPSLADTPPDNRVPANEQAENTDKNSPSEAISGDRHVTDHVTGVNTEDTPSVEYSPSVTQPEEEQQQNSVHLETNLEDVMGDERTTARSETGSTPSSSRTENQLSSLSNVISQGQPSDDRSNNQSANHGEDTNQSTRQERSQWKQMTGFYQHIRVRLTQVFLTSSSHSGISSQRTPNRVVRVRRSYDGPELVQVRVISELVQLRVISSGLKVMSVAIELLGYSRRILEAQITQSSSERRKHNTCRIYRTAKPLANRHLLEC